MVIREFRIKDATEESEVLDINKKLIFVGEVHVLNGPLANRALLCLPVSQKILGSACTCFIV